MSEGGPESNDESKKEAEGMSAGGDRKGNEAQGPMENRVPLSDTEFSRAITSKELRGELKGFAMYLAKDSTKAADLVQETLIKAWVNRRTFSAGTKMKPWLFSIMSHSFISDLRKRAREVVTDPLDLSLHPSDNITPERVFAAKEALSFLNRIPPEQRDALNLSGAYEMTNEEAAEILDVPVGTIKSRLHRGRAKLNQLLQDAERIVSEEMKERVHLTVSDLRDTTLFEDYKDILPPDERATLDLWHSGKLIPDIAKELKIREETARTYLREGTRMLKAEKRKRTRE